MTALASSISSLLVGSSAVPTAAGVMGPLQATTGLIGSGGAVNWGLLSSGLSLASAAGSLFAGMMSGDAEIAQSRQQAQALQLEAQEDELQASQELIKGKQDSNQIMDTLLQTISAQRLAASVNGIDPSFGTPAALNENTRNLANVQMSVSREDALIRSLSRRRQAAARQVEAGNVLAAGRQKATAATREGYVGALGTLGELAMRRAERG